MTAWIIIGSILLFITALVFLPIRYVLTYNEKKGLELRLHLLCFSFDALATQEKIDKRRERTRERARKILQKRNKQKLKQAKKAGGTPAEPPPPPLPPTKPTLWEDIVFLRGVLAALLRKTGKYLHLKASRIYVRVATGDAAETAVLYGAVSGAVTYLLAILDRITLLHVKEKTVYVFPDYLADSSAADIRIVLGLRVWSGVALLFSVAFTSVKIQYEQELARQKKRRAKLRQQQKQASAAPK